MRMNKRTSFSPIMAFTIGNIHACLDTFLNSFLIRHLSADYKEIHFSVHYGITFLAFGKLVGL